MTSLTLQSFPLRPFFVGCSPFFLSGSLHASVSHFVFLCCFPSHSDKEQSSLVVIACGSARDFGISTINASKKLKPSNARSNPKTWDVCVLCVSLDMRCVSLLYRKMGTEFRCPRLLSPIPSYDNSVRPDGVIVPFTRHPRV